MAPNININVTGSSHVPSTSGKQQKSSHGCFPCPSLLLRLVRRFRQLHRNFITSSASHPDPDNQNAAVPEINGSTEHIPATTIPASSHQTSHGSIISSAHMLPSHARKPSKDWEMDHHLKKVVWREGLLQNLGRLHGSGFCRLSLGELIDLDDNTYRSEGPNGDALHADANRICNPLPLIPSASPPPPSNFDFFVAESESSDLSHYFPSQIARGPSARMTEISARNLEFRSFAVATSVAQASGIRKAT